MTDESVEFSVGSKVSLEQMFKSSFAKSFVTNCHDVYTNTPKNKIALSEDVAVTELDHLRKQCELLVEENRRLQSALQIHHRNQEPQAQAIDNVFLQTQLDTLQWQLKQTESNRQMYRSLMKQVVHFLGRAQKSLNILHASTTKRKNVIRNMRSQSVYIDESPITSTPNSDSRFTRAKSVAQISTSSSNSSTCSGFREFTWSIESSNNHVPPEKLSQEAFRLMRTIESLLAMREPSLLMVSRAESSSSSSSTGSSSSGVAVDEDSKSTPVAVEDESGFSSLSSFQDVRLAHSSIKGGCHSEIGLPEIPLDKINHRRWSSTPAEIQALFKRYKNGFMSDRGPNESLSVWV